MDQEIKNCEYEKKVTKFVENLENLNDNKIDDN